MRNDMTELKRLARDAELQVIERNPVSGLHVTVVGERIVHWWPESRRQTAYVEGSSGSVSHATPKRVVQLAGGK